VSIDVNCHLVHKQFVNTVHREEKKGQQTQSHANELEKKTDFNQKHRKKCPLQMNLKDS